MLYKRYLKRLFDIIGALIFIFGLSPFIGLVAVSVRIKLGHPIIFIQKRPGLNETVFNMYKFRTMRNLTNKEGEELPDAQRLTDFGRWLRSTSMDELPELMNILKGEMSFVGPRPLLVEYLPLYNDKHRKRHEVRPGLTGLAQVKGRNMLSWEEKFDLDVEYVDKLGALQDIRIIISTIKMVVLRKGISSAESETAEKFIGY